LAGDDNSLRPFGTLRPLRKTVRRKNWPWTGDVAASAVPPFLGSLPPRCLEGRPGDELCQLRRLVAVDAEAGGDDDGGCPGRGGFQKRHVTSSAC